MKFDCDMEGLRGWSECAGTVSGQRLRQKVRPDKPARRARNQAHTLWGPGGVETGEGVRIQSGNVVAERRHRNWDPIRTDQRHVHDARVASNTDRSVARFTERRPLWVWFAIAGEGSVMACDSQFWHLRTMTAPSP